MTGSGRAAAALFRSPLPEGFARRVYRAAPGDDIDLHPALPPDAVVVVDDGELEIQCRAGGCRSFGRGAMIPVARIPVARLRSVGPGALVLVAVTRTSDDFPVAAGSHDDD